MACSMNSSRVNNLFCVHGIRIKSCNFLWRNVRVFNSSIKTVLFWIAVAVLLNCWAHTLILLHIYFLSVSIKSLPGLIKLIFLINCRSFCLEEVILRLGWPVVRIAWWPRFLISHKVLQLIRSIIRDINCLINCVSNRGHHSSSHNNIAVPFILVSVLWLPIILVLDNIYSIDVIRLVITHFLSVW